MTATGPVLGARGRGAAEAERRPGLCREDGTPVRALVVDADAGLVELLGMALRREGWQVRAAGDGAEALRTARQFGPDVVVLEVALPDTDGLGLLRRMRAEVADIPTLILSWRGEVAERVAGLSAGADDYVTKPYSLEEVVARLRALVRRTPGIRSGADAPRLVVGDLVLDEQTREVRRGGQPVELTGTQFALLHLFMRHPRRVLSKVEIHQQVWGPAAAGSASIVEIYICHLRRQMEGAGPRMIHTLRGAGYILKPSA